MGPSVEEAHTRAEWHRAAAGGLLSSGARRTFSDSNIETDGWIRGSDELNEP